MCWYGIWGRSCNSCWGWSNPRAALSKAEMQSPRIQDCAGVLWAPCAPRWQRNLIPPPPTAAGAPGAWSAAFISNKNLHLWELISLFRVCSWTVNRLRSPNLSSDGSVGLFPWAHSGASGTAQQALQELSWECSAGLKRKIYFSSFSQLWKTK